jgi:hypothetical protein
MLDFKARQAKMDWTIKVATIIERIPVILPDTPTWRKEYRYEDLRTHRDQFEKNYAKEFMPDPDENILLTEEELHGCTVCLLLAKTKNLLVN